MRLLKSRKKTRGLVSIWGSPQGGHHATTTTSGGSSARARSTVSSGGSLAQIIINSFSVISSSLLIFLALLPTLGESEILKFHSRRTLSAADGDYRPPHFISKPTVYKVKVGSSITLSCEAVNLGQSVIVWKEPTRIISAGQRMIRKDSRMKLIPTPTGGMGLRIERVTPDDRGDYTCEIETYGDPLSQRNQLDVLVPPVINMLNPGNNITVRRGSTVKLSCNATGFPPPEIVWQREYQMLPSGEKERSGSSLILQNASRLDSGTYICAASNGVETTVDAKIKLRVIYEPEIQVDKAWVHSHVGIESEISCIVHSNPEASVRWYRDTMLLEPNEHRLMEQFGIRHTLVLRKVNEGDFGNYSCSAENALGRSRAFIEVSGKPNEAVVTSVSNGYYSDHYNLTWSVHCYSKIDQYRISYRKSIPRSDPMFDTRSRWHNIVPNMKQVYGSSDPPHQSGSYMFYALEPSSKYEVVIQSQNEWGWSRNSVPFFFVTKSTDFKPKVDETKAKDSVSDKGVHGIEPNSEVAVGVGGSGEVGHDISGSSRTTAFLPIFNGSAFKGRVSVLPIFTLAYITSRL